MTSDTKNVASLSNVLEAITCCVNKSVLVVLPYDKMRSMYQQRCGCAPNATMFYHGKYISRKHKVS
jgi:hypothetical protein